MKNRLYKNYAYNTIYQIIVLVLPLILTPFVTRIIGAEGIGQYSYSRSIVTYFVLIGTLGSNMYGQREIAYVSKDEEKRNQTFWEIFIIRILLLAISLLGYLISQVRFGRYPLLFAIQIIDILAAGADITWFFQGMEQFEKIVKRNILIKIVSAGAILLLIKDSRDLWKYVLIYALGNLLGQLWLWKDAKLGLFAKLPGKDTFFRHLGEMLRLFIPQISIQIYLVVDKTMIEVLTNKSAETGYYELAQTIQRTGVTIVTAFGTVASARIASLKTQEKQEEIEQLIAKSMEIVCFLGIPISLGLSVIASNLIPWFMGQGYESVIVLLIMLCPLIFIIGMSNVSGIQYMIPMGMQNKVTISTVIGAVLNVVLNALLISTYGALGAAIASVVAELSVLVIQYYLIRHIIWKGRVFKRFLQCGVSGGIMFVIVEQVEKRFLFEPHLLNTIMLVVIGIIVYAVMMMFFEGMRKKFTLESE